MNQTLEYFLEKSGSAPIAFLRQRMVQRLIRMKALDPAQLQGRFVVLIDGSGYLVFGSQHCDHCLRQRHGETTLYMHQVLEAKLLGPADTVVSIATEFIDNSDAQSVPAGASQEQLKQDCELKALRRLMAGLRGEFPQLRICLDGDSLYACGEGFQIAKDYKCDYIYVFKPGRTPALWQDFQGLLRLCPGQQVEQTTPQGVRQVYRWVNGLRYTDSDDREWTFNAVECTETNKEGKKSVWSWVTSLEVSHQTVVEVATNGGRQRWRTENEGFNTQKNSGLNLEHAYSHTCWAAYYYLLQIAHLLLQLLEKGSLLRTWPASKASERRWSCSLVEEHGAAVVGEPAVPALPTRPSTQQQTLDPDPARHQLVVSGVRVCSRLGRVALGLVAIALKAPFEPVPLCLFRPAVGPLARFCTHAPSPWVVFLRAAHAWCL